MKKSAKMFFRCICLILGFMLLLTGCANQITNPDFEDVVYKIDVPGSPSENITSSETDASSEQQTSSLLDSYVSSDTTSSEENENNEEDNKVNRDNVEHVNKFSCMETRLTADKFMSTIAYIEGNVVKDTMFDAAAFTASHNFHYGYGEGDSRRPLTKADWENMIYNYEFKKGINADAIEEATAKVKELLKLPDDYKFGLYLDMRYPVTSVTDWGYAYGRNLNLSINQDRIDSLKWLVDESIKVFNSKGYKHVELLGFYYYQESASASDKDFLVPVTDYVRSKGLKTIWAPFYSASGWSNWKEYGFDSATMQSNYFPGSPGLPNAGGIGRLSDTAIKTKAYGMGLEIELTGVTKAAVTGFKEYLKNGVISGQMHNVHTYWLESGPPTVKALSESGDAYIRSAYQELYKYIKGALTIDEIRFD